MAESHREGGSLRASFSAPSVLWWTADAKHGQAPGGTSREWMPPWLRIAPATVLASVGKWGIERLAARPAEPSSGLEQRGHHHMSKQDFSSARVALVLA